MDADSGELVVEDTVGDIIADVLNRLHDHVLNRSAKPFLAKKAKDSLVCMIDASFLAYGGRLGSLVSPAPAPPCFWRARRHALCDAGDAFARFVFVRGVVG